MYAVKATGTLRVSREGELEGLDLHEHGMVAYPEYVIHGDGIRIVEALHARQPGREPQSRLSEETPCSSSKRSFVPTRWTR